MKKTLLFLTLIVAAFSSCKKDDSYSGPYTPPYHIDGIRDITMQKTGATGFAMMDLYVNYENSNQERVTLSVEGRPAGLYTSFTDSSGYPSFNSRLALIDSSATAGDYAMKLVATGSLSGRKEFPFSLHVLPAPQTNNFITGNGYSSFTSCGGGMFVQNITAAAGSTTNVVFSNFDNTGNAVTGIVSGTSNSGSIYIPTQTVNGVTYSSASTGYYYVPTGSGARQIQIDYYRSNGGSSTYCTLNMVL